MSYNITKRGTYTVKLAPRLTPQQRKDLFQTIHITTGIIPIEVFRERVKNVNDDSIFNKNDPYTYSYLFGDLVYSWKHPDHWNGLKVGTSSKMIIDNNTKTVEEAEEYDDNTTRVYTAFNGTHIEQYVKYIDQNTSSMEKDVFAFDNSEDLMNAIDVPGIVLNNGELFSKEDIENDNEKRRTIKITEEGGDNFRNVAHEGIIKDENGNYVAGKFQRASYKQELEWYFPYFDQRDGNTQTNMFKKMKKESGEYYYTINTKYWLKQYKLCQHHTYRSDNRFTLLYRIYDISKERILRTNKTKKLNYLDIFYTAALPFGYGNINTKEEIKERMLEHRKLIILNLLRHSNGWKRLEKYPDELGGDIVQFSFTGLKIIKENQIKNVKKLFFKWFKSLDKFYKENKKDGVHKQQSYDKITVEWKMRKNKKILKEYEQDLYNMKRRRFASIKKTADPNGGTGELFYKFNSSPN